MVVKWTNNRIATIALAGVFLQLSLGNTFGDAAFWDDASQPVYSNGWQLSDNGGYGFPSWILKATTSDTNVAGFVVASSTSSGFLGVSDLDTGGMSWGVYASAGSTSTAFRNIATGTNNSLRFSIATGNISSGQFVGFSFRSQLASSGPSTTAGDYAKGSRVSARFGSNATELTIADYGGNRDIPFTWTGKVIDVSLRILTNDQYQLDFRAFDGTAATGVVGQLATNAFAGPNSPILGLSLYSLNAGAHPTGTLYVNRLAQDFDGDVFEPDDSPDDPNFINWDGPCDEHQFNSSRDEDWFEFPLSELAPVSAEITNLGVFSNALQYQLYYRLADGSLTGFYPSPVPVVVFPHAISPLPAFQGDGLYYLKIWPASTNQWGAGSEYCLELITPVGGGGLIVVAVDKLNTTQSPPGAQVTINGGMTSNFNGRTSISYTNMTAGVYTVRVTTAAGFLPEEDPAAPNQSTNLLNALYGNPKRMTQASDTWQALVFQFIPHVRVTGVVEDAWTGDKVAGAKIEFTATNGNISNLVYAGYPSGATYQSLWFTRADGAFPTNVLLPTVNYKLRLTKAGYSNLVQNGAIVAPVPAATNSMGLKQMIPLDVNGNQVGDTWETLYFGSLVNATNDADGDGQNNANEYWSGTIPTNAASVFQAAQANMSNGLTIVWPVVAGRKYQVLTAAHLVTGNWTLAAGPWTAAVGQMSMQWTDTSLTTGWYYGVQVRAR